ncbi:unnamed protein product [Cylindrotheca closterium]|uniref:Uncharacterized protein n=1 Tax=Cylindrotheca closterium TaxID=2856 RepID=A0AAD2G9F0_9STRA|nr:unnamed protein product [Cylindrotheca closterium]
MHIISQLASKVSSPIGRMKKPARLSKQKQHRKDGSTEKISLRGLTTDDFEKLSATSNASSGASSLEIKPLCSLRSNRRLDVPSIVEFKTVVEDKEMRRLLTHKTKANVTL